MGDLGMRKRLTPEERRERRRQRHAAVEVRPALHAHPGCPSSAASPASSCPSTRPGTTPSGYFLWAGRPAGAAAVFDGLDGRVARATNTDHRVRGAAGQPGRRAQLRHGARHPGLPLRVLPAGASPTTSCGTWAGPPASSSWPAARSGWRASTSQVGFVDSRFFVGMPIPAGRGLHRLGDPLLARGAPATLSMPTCSPSSSSSWAS